jgi:hypothetical protein
MLPPVMTPQNIEGFIDVWAVLALEIQWRQRYSRLLPSINFRIISSAGHLLLGMFSFTMVPKVVEVMRDVGAVPAWEIH